MFQNMTISFKLSLIKLYSGNNIYKPPLKKNGNQLSFSNYLTKAITYLENTKIKNWIKK